MNLDIYEPIIDMHAISVMSGDNRREIRYDDPFWVTNGPKVVRAFVADDDLQEMTISSANVGIVYTYTKRLKPETP